MIDKLKNILTVKQRDIFSFIQSFFAAHGFPPSIREIGGNFHIAPSSVLDHLRALEKKGYIKRIPSRSRCLEIIKKEAAA